MRFPLLGAVFMAAALCFPAHGFAETLQDAVQEAITTHPSILAAKEAAGASAENVREQRSAYFPEISASVSGGRLYSDSSTTRGLSVTRGTGYSYMGEGSATLTQRIYDFGETGNKVDAAKARETAAGSVVIGTEEGVALRAIQAFVGLLRAGEMKQKSEKNLASISEYREKIAVQVQEGGSDEAELNRADDFLLLAKNAATEFDGQYQQALAD
ncbi:MAG: TolC family protein, partial [Alphaproteobacteria bacterium]|nr:TolC family protein [Alphaproteobacteria bacterium]